jgi:opacity protein-like surface antigen
MDKQTTLTARLITALAAGVMAYACAAQPARAQDTYELTLLSSYRLGGHLTDDINDQPLKFDEHRGYGVAIDVPYDATGQLELAWSHSHQSLNPDGVFSGPPLFHVDVDYIHVGGVYVMENKWVNPFVLATIGVTRMDPNQNGLNAATNFSMALGGGAKWWLTRHLGLRVEGRGYLTLLDTSGALFCGKNGCVARISGSGFTQFEVSAGVFAAY